MKQKVALVTGANKGIGLAIATELGKQGFYILLSGRDQERVLEAVETLKTKHISVQGVVLDVSDVESIKNAAQKIQKTIPKIDVLVNNAGVLLDGKTPLLETSLEQWTQTFNTNIFGVFHLVQNLLPLLGSGSRVINISSGGGQILEGVSTWAPIYCMSKTTLNALTMQLAVSLQPKEVAINAMCPGWVKTDMGGVGADREVTKGAETAVWLATEAPFYLTGKFFRDKQEIHW